MTDEPAERQLAAIVSAELADRSRRMEADLERARSAFDAHRRELIEPAVGAHQGRTIASYGDRWLFEFVDALDAVGCALAVQQGMSERNANLSRSPRMEFRIGVDSDGAEVALRLGQLAEPGAICVSQSIRDRVIDKLPIAFDDMGEREFAGIARVVRVYRVMSSLAASVSGPLAARDLAARRRTSRELAGVGAALLLAGLTLLAYLHA